MFLSRIADPENECEDEVSILPTVDMLKDGFIGYTWFAVNPRLGDGNSCGLNPFCGILSKTLDYHGALDEVVRTRDVFGSAFILIS